MSASDEFTGPVAVMRARSATVINERVRLSACLRALRDAVGYAGAKTALDAEWQRLVADDPNRAAREGFVG